MRSWNSLKNILTGFGGQLLTVLLSFAVRTVFIYTLSKSYLGISGLYGSLLTVLSLSELGVGAAIAFAMYKPVAEDDREALKSLVRFYKRAYQYIGCAFLLVGLALLPFLPWLMKGGTELVNARLLFLLYILDPVTSYLFFAYKGAVLQAYQQGYTVSLLTYVGKTLTAAARILLLLLLRRQPTVSFYVYTVVGIAGNVLTNLLVKRKVDARFPFLLEREVRPLSREERRPILKNVAGLSAAMVCDVLNDGIDSTIVSAAIGVAAVGVFSNYLMLRRYVTQFLSTIFGSLTASLGNFCATESVERQEDFFRTLHFTYFWLYGFCAICLWMLYDPFIAGMWLDESWLLRPVDVALLAGNFLLDGLTGAVVKYRNALGLFWQLRWRYVISSVFNAALSVLLAVGLKLGVTGALLGTTASLLITVLYDPVLVFKTAFHRSPWVYYRSYLGYLALICATGGVVWLLTLPLAAHTAVNCLLKLAVCLVLPNGLWFLLFRRRPEFRYLRDKAAALLGRLLRRDAPPSGNK